MLLLLNSRFLLGAAVAIPRLGRQKPYYATDYDWVTFLRIDEWMWAAACAVTMCVGTGGTGKCCYVACLRAFSPSAFSGCAIHCVNVRQTR